MKIVMGKNKISLTSVSKLILTFLLSFSFSLLAQDINDEVSEAGKEAQNPLGNIISMPFQNNTDFGYGPYDKTTNTLNIQPILPFSIGAKGWVLINRFIIPFPKTVPDISTENGPSTTGLGDITYSVYMSAPTMGKWTIGPGAVTVWPTATDDALGSNKFSAGPSGIIVFSDPSFMLAGIISQWWSVGGKSEAKEISTFYFQYIFTYFLPKKWYVLSAPINLADWTAPEGQKWWIPVGGGGGKMFNIGKIPMDVQVQAFYYAVKPDNGPDWGMRLQLKFIFPKGK